MKILNKIGISICVLALTISLAGCKSASKSDTTSEKNNNKQEESTTQSFPKFKGKDFDGNEVDESIFKDNKVTLLNFWYNECSACVGEMTILETFNKTLKEKGAEIIGVNVKANSEEILNEAKEILKKQGATYKNIVINDGDEAKDFVNKITMFPTTYLIDQNGNIVGKPIIGALNSKKTQENILNIIEKYSSGEDVSKENFGPSEAALKKFTTELNKIYENHKERWDKVTANIPEDQEQDTAEDISTRQMLKDALEKSKDQLTEEEIRTANEDIKQIENLEKELYSSENN